MLGNALKNNNKSQGGCCVSWVDVCVLLETERDGLAGVTALCVCVSSVWVSQACSKDSTKDGSWLAGMRTLLVQ